MRSAQRLFCVQFVVVCFGFKVVWPRCGRGFPSWLCMSQNQLRHGLCLRKLVCEQEAMKARASRDCTVSRLKLGSLLRPEPSQASP